MSTQHSSTTGAPTRSVMDVSDVAATDVRAFADLADGREVYLERKGGRTVLVSES